VKRRQLCLAGGGALLGSTGARAGVDAAIASPGASPEVQPGAPSVLRQPALQTPRALGAAMLAVTRAGRRLVAAGERGIVLLSDDDGASWQQARVPVQVSLTALRFIDERRGWASGHLGVILRTEDAGSSWSLQLDGVRLARQVLASADNGAAQARAHRLVAEGPDKAFLDLDVVGPRGFAVGAFNQAVETRDGGASWQPLSARLPNARSLHLYAVRCLGEQVFIAGEQGLLLRSADGGESFSALTSPYKGSFFGLLVTRAGSLIAYGLRGNAFRSADGGASWQKLQTAVSVSLSAGLELADGTLVLLAQTGELLLSRDDGQRFERRAATEPLPAAGLAAGAAGQLVIASLRGLKRLPIA
jgi:photosystem II stability/assembly factor-like uncharacterized protein